MPQTVIKSRLKAWPADKPSVEVTYDLPDTLAGLVEKFGEQVVAAKCIDSVVIDIQANVRREIAKPDDKRPTQEALQAKISAFKPSSSTATRRSPQEKVEDLASKMSPEEKKALIAKLREDLKNAG